MDTSFSGHSGDAVSVVRNSRFKENQTLENHISCAKIINECETNINLLHHKIIRMSPKHFDSHIKIKRLHTTLELLRASLDTELHSQVKIPNGASHDYLDHIYQLSPTNNRE